ncbi:MAG: EAL domain-containing protein [Paraburkholderia sp.]|uniref:EAL domain-containing protein n=1 Tax=Paraburkholderia sp. TaxID=1926495 RepID=UPI003C63AEAA
MAFEFPLPIARFPAFIVLCRPRRRVMAMLVVACVCSSLARADATVDAGSRGGSTLERNVWEQLEDWFADTPAPARPLRFGIACAHPPQLFVVPAELAGPVAGLMPAPPNTCDSLNDASIDTSGLAHAVVNGGPQVVMLLRELPWEMGYPGTADQNAAGASAIAAAAGSSSQVDRLKETPEPPVTSLSGCSSGAACEERPALAPSNGIERLPSMQPATDIPTDRIRASAIFGFLLWPVLLAVFAVGVGWSIKRWLRYDRALLRAARAGLRRGEFHVEYQPVVGVRRARCVGVEALLRWDNEKYGALGPGHYMPFVESSGLMGPMTRFIFSLATQELREVGAPKSLYLGVTAPSSHLKSSAFMAEIGDDDSLGFPPLILKIDAASVREFGPRLIPMMTEAREKGVRFALSGVRSTDLGLQLPKDISFEMVKIDREVLTLDPDERSRQLDALTKMGHDLGAVVVVEGIENAAHHNVARVSRAEFGQGFFYSRALSANRLKEFLQTINAPSSRTGGAATVLGWRVRNY